jgi:hypothetical protein
MDRRMTLNELADRIQRGKSEILHDIEAGIVPADVDDFAKLHDYVDANCYGGMCDDDAMDLALEEVVLFQDAIHLWLRYGRPEALEPMGAATGRFNCDQFRQEPLWEQVKYDYDEPSWEPNYYGQTLALARYLGGQVWDAAGGYAAVLMPVVGPDAPEGAAHEFIGYDQDDMRRPLIRFFDSEDESLDTFLEIPVILFGEAGE